MPTRLGAAGRRVARQVRNPWQVPAEGLDRLPAGGAIVAVNRSGAFDHLQVAYSLGRPATVLVDPEAGLAPWPTLRRTTWAGEPERVLARGELLIVFPEIHVGGPGTVHKGYPQLASLALAAKVPIVPAGLTSSGRTRLRLGEQLQLGRHALNRPLSDTLDGYILRGITDTVMLRIAELAGADYADRYATPGAGPAADARAALQQIGELRALWRSRRESEAQRRADEADLVRQLDEQDQQDFDEAVEAAQQQAADAAAKWRGE